MPILNSETLQIRKDYSLADLERTVRRMRLLNEASLCAARSGHSGGTLSVMDIAAVLYLKVARHDPEKPNWHERDRIIWSAGHKAPALYTSLAVSGYFPEEELLKLRMLGSPLQGHPHWRDLPGVEITSGSLGQGLSVSVGMALAARLDAKKHQLFTICSDGEMQEGAVWESLMSAAHHQLDNLTLIIDANKLQIDGKVSDIMKIEPLAEKLRAFNWKVTETDGHDIKRLVSILSSAREDNNGSPNAIICHTNKGQGVSFMVGKLAWHGKAPDKGEFELLKKELDPSNTFQIDKWLHTRKRLEEEIDREQVDRLPYCDKYAWNNGDSMRSFFEPNRVGFGKGLEESGSDERIVCIGADISDSICISSFYKKHPERLNRFISVGIAEQNGTTVAAGLAREGKFPIFGTYGVFASARNLDQLRVSICYANLNVLIVGAHGGISVGPDGATHQELESFFQICGLPNMNMAAPLDSIETERMMKTLLFEIDGPKYLRLARESSPIITSYETPFRFGEGSIFRFRSEKNQFADAFECYLSSDYKDEKEQITIISCGTITAEAMRAAWILKSEHGIETRLLHLHTLKPLDSNAIVRAAAETSHIITVEEHQKGGLGNMLAGVISTSDELRGRTVSMEMIGIPDRFGESGRPEQLLRKFGLTAEHIAHRAKALLHE